MNTAYNREHMNSRADGLTQTQAVRQSTIKSRFEELDKAIANNTDLLNQLVGRLTPVLNPIAKAEKEKEDCKVEPPMPVLAPVVEALELLTRKVNRNSIDLERLLQALEL